MPTSKVIEDFYDIGLATVLHRYRLAVPPNQREYSWRDIEVQRMFTDIAKAMAESEDYFLGTVVTVPVQNGVLEIVDGQQRLSTTTILLAAIRNYLKASSSAADKDLATHIDTQYLRTYVTEARAHRPKLQLNLDDNEFFKSMLEAETKASRPSPQKHSHELIVGAFDVAAKHVAGIVRRLDSKDHGDELARWVTFLVENAMVLLLKVSDATKAFRMFETLNDRGLKTSQADMVKNYLFEQAPGRRGEVAQKWSYMRGALEAVEDEDLTVTFIRHSLIATNGFLREGDVLGVVQDLAKGPDRSVRLLQVFEDLSRLYAALFNPDHEQWNEYPNTMQKSLEVLRLFDIKPFRPLMLAIASSFHPGEAAKAFKYLASLGVRLIVASSTRSESVEKPLAIAAKKVYDGEMFQASELQKELKGIWPSDELFQREFAQITVSKQSLARYYLRSLELGCQGDSEPQFMPTEDTDAITLEHVLPEKPMGNWPQFEEETIKHWSKRLGNLALLKKSQNNDLRSVGFDKKKVVYADSSYVLTRQIADLDQWTRAEIADRQATIAEIAVKVWA